jgi:uncharacterized membrane protein
MRINKKILGLFLFAFVIFPIVVFAQVTLPGIANRVKEIFQTIGLAIVFIGWIIAGILWLISGGAPEKTGIAKKAIIACTIGTVLIILAAASGPIINLISTSLGLPVPAGAE